VTMVWVVRRFRLKTRPGISPPYISPLTPSGQRNCASWASQPQKSVTRSPHPGGKATKFIRTCGRHWGGGGGGGVGRQAGGRNEKVRRRGGGGGGGGGDQNVLPFMAHVFRAQERDTD
jgi:hypothetical protein